MRRMGKSEKLDKAVHDYCVAAVEDFCDALAHAPNGRAVFAMLATLLYFLDATGLSPEEVVADYRKTRPEAQNPFEASLTKREKGGLS